MKTGHPYHTRKGNKGSHDVERPFSAHAVGTLLILSLAVLAFVVNWLGQGRQRPSALPATSSPAAER